MGRSVIITGSSGMVGKGVLLECLESNLIDKVLVINRSSINIRHNKLTELILKDFTKINAYKDVLQNYDACFYCMGISSIGLNEESYHAITFETTHAFAELLYELNPELQFNYVSGTGTDSSEKGRIMWARVKGKTENMIFSKFKNAIAFRPGIILPEKGIKSKTGWYNTLYAIARPLFPLLKKSKNVTSTTNVGQAMINSLFADTSEQILENRAINDLAVNIK